MSFEKCYEQLESDVRRVCDSWKAPQLFLDQVMEQIDDFLEVMREEEKELRNTKLESTK